MTTCFGKSVSIGLECMPFMNIYQFVCVFLPLLSQEIIFLTRDNILLEGRSRNINARCELIFSDLPSNNMC